QVLDLAKIESGRAEWRIGQVDVREIVNQALAQMSQMFKDKGVRLQAQLPPQPVLALADADRLLQVLLNLLSNALKFCRPEIGEVQVVVSRDQNAVRIDVRDNGPGVRPEDLPYIFDKFRQGGDTLTAKPPGTGLGLHISREIIAHMGGRLWVESEYGHGACFSFTLPLAAPRGQDIQSCPQANARS
ncbi:MAG: HAMP domain-containing histidine kinase, partial [Burkholderiaceae bacterium]|nr:HAMP domain-containing histidine kinase [Burkholderiaceae bacterium]